MADKLYGYVGKILRVNLSTGEITTFSSEKYQDMYLGGKGMAARIYWDEIGPEVKPFDPENKVIFTSGAFKWYRRHAGCKRVCCR